MNSATANRFITANKFAVVGASTDRSKYGNRVLRWYQANNLTVIPVNHKEATVESVPAISSIDQLSDPANVAISIITPPKVTLAVLKQAKELGIKRIWLQPGAEDKAVLDYANEAGLDIIAGGPCILVSAFSVCSFTAAVMPVASNCSKDNQDFLIGNRPEGLNVKASVGPPSAWNQLSHLSLKQDVEQFGLAGKIWHAAYIFQSYLSPDTRADPQAPIPREYFLDDPSEISSRPYRILELGAGTGYVGIYLAKMLRRPCQVIITDLEQVVPLIKDNVAAHYQPCSKNAASVRVERLHWGSAADADAVLQGRPIDLIVVSDCVYFPELFEILTDTLVQLCSPSTKVVIGYKCRSLEKEAGFWQDYFGRYFEYQPVRKLELEESNSELQPGGLLGEEEGVFVFVGSRRPGGQVKAADDTFTTILFCNMMDL